MKNPFETQNKTGMWIAGLGIGLVAAGAAAYYWVKNSGETEAINEGRPHPTDYLANRNGSTKKHKSDVSELAQMAS
jgi:hypothetical protein